MEISYFSVVFHPSTNLVLAFKSITQMKSCPRDTQSFRSSLKACLWLIHRWMWHFECLNLSIPHWHTFLHGAGLNVAAPSHPLREDSWLTWNRVLEICNLLYVTLAVNAREWPCHDSFWCYISAVRILSWVDPVNGLHQCHFTRRAGGVNEEAQRSLIIAQIHRLRVGMGEWHT